MNQILVGGIGNIFMGDDAFGVEVVQRLTKSSLPDGVRVVDFGIRGIDLVYALLDGYDAVILIDTAQLGAPPGTVRILAPQPDLREPLPPEGLLFNAHDLDPAKVLRLASTLGNSCRQILLVACQPATFGHEDAMELSPGVAAAVDVAVAVVEKLVLELQEPRRSLADCANSGRLQDRFRKLADPLDSSTKEGILNIFTSIP